MNYRRLATAAVATIAAATIGLSITAAAAPASQDHASQDHASSQAHARTTQTKVLVDCLNKKQVEPRSFVLACADGNAYLDKMAWTSWTPAMAGATARLVENDCNPNCAGGHFHAYPALVVAWGSKAFHGSQRYTELTVIFTGNRPPIFNGHKWVPGPQTFTYDLFAAP